MILTKYKYIILLCLISFTISANYPSITTFADQKVDFSLTKDEIKKIISSFAAQETFTTTFWNFVDAGTVWNGKLNITNFVGNFSLNDNKLIFSEGKDKFLVNGNDSISLNYNVSYTSKTGANTFPAGTGVLTV